MFLLNQSQIFMNSSGSFFICSILPCVISPTGDGGKIIASQIIFTNMGFVAELFCYPKRAARGCLVHLLVPRSASITSLHDVDNDDHAAEFSDLGLDTSSRRAVLT